MSTRSLRCNSCNAPLSVEDDGAKTFRCSFCGVVNQLAPSVRTVVVIQPPGQAPLGARRAIAPVVVLVSAVAVAVTGAVLSLLLRSPSHRVVVTQSVAVPPPTPRPPPVSARDVPSRPNVPMGPDNLYWLDQYISPVPVDANGDGVEDIAGGFILNENGRLNAYAGVIDGATWRVLWKAGPWGDRKKATRSTGVAVKEGRLLAVNVLGDAIVYDLKTGEQLLAFTFDEEYPARWICAPSTGNSVYLGASWSRGTLVNMKTLTREPASAPKECSSDERRPGDTGDVSKRRAKNETKAAPKFERYDASSWLHDGVRGVMLGAPRGSDALELVGFDPLRHVETWRQPVAALAPRSVGQKVTPLELAEGRYFFAYNAHAQEARTGELELHIVAVDPSTGERLWDAVSPGNSVYNLSVSPTRLYVVTLEWDPMPVNVFDLKSGSLIARLGGASSRY